MVLEFVPESDLHHLLQKSAENFSMKWRLKVAIDCASGLKYVLVYICFFFC